MTLAAASLRKQRGAFALWSIIGGAILLVAYMAYPQPFHDFVQYLINGLLDAADKSFEGASDPSSGKGPAKGNR